MNTPTVMDGFTINAQNIKIVLKSNEELFTIIVNHKKPSSTYYISNVNYDTFKSQLSTCGLRSSTTVETYLALVKSGLEKMDFKLDKIGDRMNLLVDSKIDPVVVMTFIFPLTVLDSSIAKQLIDHIDTVNKVKKQMKEEFTTEVNNRRRNRLTVTTEESSSSVVLNPILLKTLSSIGAITKFEVNNNGIITITVKPNECKNMNELKIKHKIIGVVNKNEDCLQFNLTADDMEIEMSKDVVVSSIKLIRHMTLPNMRIGGKRQGIKIN